MINHPCEDSRTLSRLCCLGPKPGDEASGRELLNGQNVCGWPFLSFRGI